MFDVWFITFLLNIDVHIFFKMCVLFYFDAVVQHCITNIKKFNNNNKINSTGAHPVGRDLRVQSEPNNIQTNLNLTTPLQESKQNPLLRNRRWRDHSCTCSTSKPTG